MLPASQINEVDALGGRAVIRVGEIRHAWNGRKRRRVGVDLQPVALRQERLRLPRERLETQASDIKTAVGNGEVVGTAVEVQVHRRRSTDAKAMIRASLRADDVAERQPLILGIQTAMGVEILVGDDAALLHESADVTLLRLEKLAGNIRGGHGNSSGGLGF